MGRLRLQCSARLWAQQHGIPVVTVEAEWDKYGRAAGPMRNRRMLRDHAPDGVVVVWDGRTRGSASMIREAKSARVPVFEFRTEGGKDSPAGARGSKTWKESVVEISVDVGDDPIEAAERAGELIAGHVRSLLAIMGGSNAARVTAMAAVLEATDRVVSVLEDAASPGRSGRAHVLALVETLVRSLDRLAPAAARGWLTTTRTFGKPRRRRPASLRGYWRLQRPRGEPQRGTLSQRSEARWLRDDGVTRLRNKANWVSALQAQGPDRRQPASPLTQTPP